MWAKIRKNDRNYTLAAITGITTLVPYLLIQVTQATHLKIRYHLQVSNDHPDK